MSILQPLEVCVVHRVALEWRLLTQVGVKFETSEVVFKQEPRCQWEVVMAGNNESPMLQSAEVSRV